MRIWRGSALNTDGSFRIAFSGAAIETFNKRPLVILLKITPSAILVPLLLLVVPIEKVLENPGDASLSLRLGIG